MDQPFTTLANHPKANALEEWHLSLTLPETQSCDKAKFNQSGTKIITCSPCGIKLWDSKTGELLTHIETVNLSNKSDTECIKLNANETKLWVISEYGERACFDTATTNLLWADQKIPIIPSVDIFSQDDRDVCNSGTTIVFNDDESKFLIRSWNKTALIDPLTGKIDTVLWEHKDQNNSRTIVADFHKNSCKAIVLHNGFLNNKTNNLLVQYNQAVPSNAHCPLYNRTDNTLIYFSNQNNQCETINLTTREKKTLSLCRRNGAALTTIKLNDNGNKMLRISYSGARWKDFQDTYCFVDVYDLVKPHLIMTIECSSEPNETHFNNKNQMLLLALREKLELWSTETQSLVWSLKNNREWLRSVAINENGDEIVINQKDIVIWKNLN